LLFKNAFKKFEIFLFFVLKIKIFLCFCIILIWWYKIWILKNKKYYLNIYIYIYILKYFKIFSILFVLGYWARPPDPRIWVRLRSRPNGLGSVSAARPKDFGSGFRTWPNICGPGCGAKPNGNTLKISHNHENTSEAPIFVLRSKSINARTCNQRDQCRPQVLSLWENPCYITKTLKNHAISLKIKPEILFIIQIPRT
jgi:hypothetical protein